MSGEKVTITIYGTEFTLRTDEDPAALKAVAAEVDREMRRVAEQSGLMQPVKVATLTALHLAGELAKVRDEHHAMRAMADRLEPLLDQAVGPEA